MATFEFKIKTEPGEACTYENNISEENDRLDVKNVIRVTEHNDYYSEENYKKVFNINKFDGESDGMVEVNRRNVNVKNDIYDEESNEPDANDTVEEDARMSDSDESDRFLVNLYRLNCDSWFKIGLGTVSTCYVRQLNTLFLMVNSDEDNAVLLLCKISSDTVFRKLQGTFITWMEEDTVLGLSFQKYSGCDKIWEEICQAQGKNPSMENTQEVAVEESKENADNMEKWYEEMLDFDQVKLSTHEMHALEQLLERIHRKVNDNITQSESLKELSKNLQYLLSLNKRKSG